jgi:hypothetical protein
VYISRIVCIALSGEFPGTIALSDSQMIRVIRGGEVMTPAGSGQGISMVTSAVLSPVQLLNMCNVAVPRLSGPSA